jgi:hypothetical protein
MPMRATLVRKKNEVEQKDNVLDENVTTIHLERL